MAGGEGRTLNAVIVPALALYERFLWVNRTIAMFAAIRHRVSIEPGTATAAVSVPR